MELIKQHLALLGLNVEDKVVVIVSRPIAKGEQLFDSYRPNFNNQSKAQRQEGLLKDYGFVCDCEACINDWPMNQNLEVFSEDLLEFAWTSHEDLPFLTDSEFVSETTKKRLQNKITLLEEEFKRQKK